MSETSTASHADKTSTSFRTKRSIWTVRGLWILFYGFGMGLALLSYIAIFQDLDHFALHSTNPFLSRLTMEQWPLLLYFRILQLIVFLIASIIALFVFWQRSSDWMAILVSLAIFSQAMSFTVPLEATSTLLGGIYFMFGNLPLFLLSFVFPTGRIFPRFARPFLPVLGLLLILPMAYRGFLLAPQDRPSIAIYINLIFVFVLGLGVAAQIYRFIHVSNPLQRQQTKWVIYGGVLAFGLRGSFVLIPQLFPQLITPLDNPSAVVLGASISSLAIISICLIPLSLAFSILRYRLWDIDIVINRSLVGVLVTLVLLLIFVPSVFLIQSLLGAENTLLSYLVSAAVPALLFNPARKRVRHFVDQRIYGLKFDLNQLQAAQQKPEIKNAGALTGKRLGQYEVLDFIGKGGMGEVYKGFADGKTVALKTLAGSFALEQDYLQRFQREAEVMKQIEHPKIARFYEAGESENLPYLVLEFIEGRELKEYLHEQGALMLEDAQSILCDIAEALDYLHSKNIVHRDIKPSNIMLRGAESHEAILMDFGIAKLEDGTTRLTGSNVIGTIDYMAPEQIMAAKEVDKRADIYALGVIAYEMLTGERPFKGSAAQVMFAHLQQPVTDPRETQPDLPETVALAILRALQKQPEDRFESAGAFVAALI